MEPWIQEDYRSTLADIIMASAREDAKLRSAIYAMARGKLRQQLHRHALRLSHAERAQRLLALETAIEQIEADLAANAAGATDLRGAALAGPGQPRMEIIPPARRLPPTAEAQPEFAANAPIQGARSARPLTLMLVAVACVAGATYIGAKLGFSWQPPMQGQSSVAVKTAAHPASDRPVAPSIPMPSAYGVYAVVGNRLIELPTLPVRVPGPRVKMSTIISLPSKVVLPSGHVQFVVFRRELVNKVPDKVEVRVVARVMRRPAPAGKATTPPGKDDAMWAIRAISHEMKVAPVTGNPAMILLRPANADVSLPAGRYALVLNATAYDFRIDGPVTDQAQCIQGDDEDAVPEFTECVNR